MTMREKMARKLTKTLRHHGVEMHPDDILGLVDDALSELGEPTLGMGDKARDMTGAGYPYSPDPIHPLGHLQIGLIWRTMIDAAKEER